MSAYQATKREPFVQKGEVCVPVDFSNGIKESNFSEIFKAKEGGPDWPDREIRIRLRQLNSIDLSGIATGAPAAEPEKPEAPPVDEEKRAFFRLFSKLYALDQAAAARALRTAGIDIDSLEAQVAAAARPEYFG